MSNVGPAGTFPVPNATLDTEAEACWNLAAWIGEISADDYQRSFTSLLIALLYSSNPTSRWFLRYCRSAGVAVDAIGAARNFRPAMLRDIQARQQTEQLTSKKGAWTVSAQNIANGATSLVSLAGSSDLGVRHLLGAYFYQLPAAHTEQMRTWGFDIAAVASALLRQMRQNYPAEVEKLSDLHTRTFKAPPALADKDPLPPPRVSGFAADSPEGEDRLGIEDDVYALSALICSTRVSPPLSIGLFGDWGSGKSFFIQQLKRGVRWISEQARGSGRLQKDLPFYKYVVQIEFNAWNYSGGNLWASLVQHILENLEISKDEPPDLLAERQKVLQDQMQLERQVRDNAEKKAAEAQKKVNEADAELRVLRIRHEQRVRELKDTVAKDVLSTLELDAKSVEKINKLRKDLKLPEVAAAAGEFMAAIDGTRAALQRATAVFEYVPEEHRGRFLAASTAVIAGPPLIAIGIGLVVGWIEPYLASTASISAWLSTTVGGGAAWIRDRTAAVNAQIAVVEGLQAHARARVQAEEHAHKANVARLEQEIGLGKDEILVAQAAQAQAQARLDQLNAQLAATTPASVLADFVQERSQSDDYRKHLGLPAIIRRDFDRISDMIAKENAAVNAKTNIEDEDNGAKHRMNRIVLYIDDLDRCSEELVVEVLKAVHLLLAFQLFVVVVAVDARWVSRSLSKRFPGLLTPESSGTGPVRGETGREHAKPTDYLEKIFQIPFWLKPPNETHVRDMVRGLLAEGATGGAAGPAAHPPPGATDQPPRVQDRVFKRRQHDPNASLLDVTAEELQYIERLAPLLERSPRALKRFANVYRLLKASLPPEEQDGFLDQSTDPAAFKTVVLLLAIVNGLPAASEVMFGRRLNGQGQEAPAGTLGALLSVAADDGEAAIDESVRLSKWLAGEFGANWAKADASAFRSWLPRVARYSYHLPR
jgi:hypothetical protein